MTRRAELASEQKLSSEHNNATREKLGNERATIWCEELSLRVWVKVAIKGESEGVTSIAVEKSRFVDFMSMESKQKSHGGPQRFRSH